MADVETVLAAQEESHLPLGQVLASLGDVDPETLDRELRAYMAAHETEKLG